MSVTISGDTGLAGAATGALNGSLGATTPNTAVVTSINKMAITAPATSSTLAVADGKGDYIASWTHKLPQPTAKQLGI